LDVFDSIGDEMDDFDADDENNCSSHNNNWSFCNIRWIVVRIWYRSRNVGVQYLME
jgi:hypothetical protein